MRDSEFGGGSGLIQEQNILNNHFNDVEQLWIVYASDTGSAADPDPRRVGDPAAYQGLLDEAPPSGVAPLPPMGPTKR